MAQIESRKKARKRQALLPGNLCTVAWSTSSTSFFSGLGVYGIVSHTFVLVHSFLPVQCFALSQVCFHGGATSVASGLSAGQRWVRFGAGWKGLCQTRGQPLDSSRRDHPCNLPPPATKALPRKPNGVGPTGYEAQFEE